MSQEHRFDIENLKRLGLDEPALEALEALERGFASVRAQAAKPIEVPEMGWSLDLESRRASELRQFKHLHQGCAIHRMHFELMSRVRFAYLLAAYADAVTSLNPYSIYGAARALLEAHAMTAFVQDGLAQAAGGDERDWLARGVRFFELIIRARYGSTDSETRKFLEGAGEMPAALAQPLRLNKAREHLSKKLPWVEGHYVFLCDAVHPNMRSNFTAALATEVTTERRNSSGGAVMVEHPTLFVRYEYGRAEQGIKATKDTAVRARESALALNAAINGLPDSPFREKEILAWTGTPFGIVSTVGAGVSTPFRAAEVPRNAVCPCGSGKKYKKCHGATQT